MKTFLEFIQDFDNNKYQTEDTVSADRRLDVKFVIKRDGTRSALTKAVTGRQIFGTNARLLAAINRKKKIKQGIVSGEGNEGTQGTNDDDD